VTVRAPDWRGSQFFGSGVKGWRCLGTGLVVGSTGATGGEVGMGCGGGWTLSYEVGSSGVLWGVRGRGSGVWC